MSSSFFFKKKKDKLNTKEINLKKIISSKTYLLTHALKNFHATLKTKPQYRIKLGKPKKLNNNKAHLYVSLMKSN